MTAQPIPDETRTTLAHWHHWLTAKLRDKKLRQEQRNPKWFAVSTMGAEELRDCIGVALGYRK